MFGALLASFENQADADDEHDGDVIHGGELQYDAALGDIPAADAGPVPAANRNHEGRGRQPGFCQTLTTRAKQRSSRYRNVAVAREKELATIVGAFVSHSTADRCLRAIHGSSTSQQPGGMRAIFIDGEVTSVRRHSSSNKSTAN